MKSFGTSKEFLFDKDQQWEVVGEGVKRKIMGYDDKIIQTRVCSRQSTGHSAIWEVLSALTFCWLI